VNELPFTSTVMNPNDDVQSSESPEVQLYEGAPEPPLTNSSQGCVMAEMREESICAYPKTCSCPENVALMLGWLLMTVMSAEGAVEGCSLMGQIGP